MLKIVHLLSGAAALLLSFIPSLRSEALPYLEQTDALYLGLFGLFNLLYAPTVSQGREGLHNLVSGLLIFAAALQALILLAPLPLIGTQPAALFSLLAGATVLGGAVAASREQRRREAAVLRALGATRAQLRRIAFTGRRLNNEMGLFCVNLRISEAGRSPRERREVEAEAPAPAGATS